MLDFLLGPGLRPFSTLPLAYRNQRVIELTDSVNLLIATTSDDQKPIWFESQGLSTYVFGVMSYKGVCGESAAGMCGKDLISGELDELELRGTFAVITTDREQVRLITDYLGTYSCYSTNGNGPCVSSSFLLLTSIPEVLRITPNAQGLYEYVFQGAAYGGGTLVNEVSRLASDQIHVLSRNQTIDRPAISDVLEGEMNCYDAGALITDELNLSFGTLAKHYDGRCASSLSGGMDSRLILGLLSKFFTSFRLHVYGHPNDQDVIIAKALADELGVDLTHIDKQELNQGASESRKETVRRNFAFFDGWPTDGIFDNGADLKSRQMHMSSGVLLLNGGGGEILRNFFYVPRRSIGMHTVVDAFYHQFDPATCTDEFDYREYIGSLQEKIETTVERLDRLSPRQKIEAVYPLFRLRYWMSRTSSINARLGHFLTPLVTPRTVSNAVRMKLTEKDNGRFESQLISQLLPTLAHHPFDSGFAPGDGPSLRKRVAYYVNCRRPMVLRRSTFRIRAAFQRPVLPGQRQKYNGLIGGFPITSRYFRPTRFTSTEQLDRLATAEYLFQQLL